VGRNTKKEELISKGIAIVARYVMFFHIVVNECLLCANLIYRLRISSLINQLVATRVNGGRSDVR
jgi:hypothetical protein